jgi:hypothetical protein
MSERPRSGVKEEKRREKRRRTEKKGKIESIRESSIEKLKKELSIEKSKEGREIVEERGKRNKLNLRIP